MGGRALLSQGIESKRLSAHAYQHVIQTFLPSFQKNFPQASSEVIRSIAQKSDFGDADILISQEHIFVAKENRSPEDNAWCKVIDWLKQEHNVKHFARNENILSFGWPLSEGVSSGQDVSHLTSLKIEEPAYFQIDLIALPEHQLDYASNYFAYNDLGNLVGKVAHAMGFKHGFTGLLYPVREGTHLLDEVLITDNYDEALAFLGFDVARYHQGFETIQDVFKYVSASRYFLPQSYDLETMNHAARIRDRKRTTYNGFLKYLEETNPPAGDLADPSKNKEISLQRAQLAFPDFSHRLSEVFARRDRQRLIKTKWSGHLVSEWTGLQAKELSRFMLYVLSQTTREAWEEKVLSSSVQDIQNSVMILYQHWQVEKLSLPKQKM